METCFNFTDLYRPSPKPRLRFASDSMAKTTWRTSTEAWGEEITLEKGQLIEFEVEDTSFLGMVHEVKDKLAKSGQTIEMDFQTANDDAIYDVLEGKKHLVHLCQNKVTACRVTKSGVLHAERF